MYVRFAVQSAALFATVALDTGNLVIAEESPAPPKSRRDARKFRIVGYLPEYRADQFDPDAGRMVTDVIYFSAKPGADGRLDLSGIRAGHLAMLKKMKQQYGTAIALCVGGWERSAGFAKLASSDEARRAFASALVKFCSDHDFDGIDIDWEHPGNETEHRDYGAMLAAIRNAFQPRHLQLSIAVAGWQTLTPEAIRSVDRVHLMAYDAEGKHSTLDFAKSDIARIAKGGVPVERICLGVPFYGRGIDDRSRLAAYSEIVRKFQPTADVDELDGLYFNGPLTIERKTRAALSMKLAGVMTWELGQDAPGDASLVRVIRRTVEESGP